MYDDHAYGADFSLLKQEVTLQRTMTYWEWVRDQLESWIAKNDSDIAKLARRAGLKDSRVRMFMSGERATMRDDALESLEQATGLALRQMPAKKDPPKDSRQNLPAQVQSNVRDELLPLVEVHHWPIDRPYLPMQKRIRKASRPGQGRPRSPRDPADPDLFYVRAPERLRRRIEPGDELQISPASSTYDGALVFVETPAGAVFGDMQIVNQVETVQTTDKRRLIVVHEGRPLVDGECRIIGPVVGGWYDKDRF